MKPFFTTVCATLFAGSVAAQQSATTAPFPVAINVDASQPKGSSKPIYRFFGADEPNYATMKDGRKLHRRARAARRAAGVLPRAQPAHHRRRHAGAQVGEHERLHRGCAGPAGVRLDDRRSDLRDVPRARRQAVRADRVHAEGALDASRALSARVAAGACPTRRSTRAGRIRRRTTRSGASSSTSG